MLIAGGENASGVSQSVEIFNPATGTFSYVGQLSLPHKGHAATVLEDGRVLITGGSFGGTSPSASSDIYNPATNSLTSGPSMAAARAGHSATTLLNGKVLIAGGNNGATDLASAELFDPASGNFSPAGSLSAARSGHLAFLLPHNNSVLLAGGASGGSALASAELYKLDWTAASGSFSSAGSMSAARAQATGSGTQDGLPSAAPALPGLLLIAGGSGLSSGDAYGFSTVKTDKDDYAPGQTVTITGSGWKPGETVTMLFHEYAGPYTDLHPPVTSVADAGGNIVNTQFSPDEHDIGVTFILTATGGTSNLQAQTKFTDAKTVDLAFAGTGSGVVTSTSSPFQVSQFNCTSTSGTGTCSVSFANNNSIVTMTAAPTAPSTIGGWSVPAAYSVTSGCGSTDLTCAFNLNNSNAPAVIVTFNPGAVNKLGITSVNGGVNPTAGTAFSVVVRSQDSGGNPSNVTANTGVSLSLNTGTGTLGGTLTGTILAGTNSVTIAGVTYNKAESGVVLTATRTSGDLLASGNSAPFTVNAGALHHFSVEKSGGGLIGTQTTGTPFNIRITALDAFNNTVTAFNGNPNKVNLTSTGTISGGSFNTTDFTNGVLDPQSVTITNSGNFTITATGIGGSGINGTSNSFTVNAANTAPTIVLSGANTADEGQTKHYTFDTTDPDAGETFALLIATCGANGTKSNQVFSTSTGDGSFDCTFPDGPNNSTVSVQVEDTAGADSNVSSIAVTISNMPPVVDVTGPAAADEGQTKTYTYTVTDPGDDPNPGITESCGANGTYINDADANQFKCTFPDGPASSTVSVTADDHDPSNNIGSDSKTVNIANVAPTVAFAGGPTVVDESGVTEHTYTYSISDPGVDTVQSVNTSCGTGGTKVALSDTNNDTSGSFKCKFLDGPASPTVTASATDSDGDTGNTAMLAVTVNNVAPTVNTPTISPEPSLAGAPVVASATFSDPGTLDTFTCTVNYGDGSGNLAGTVSVYTCTGPSHVYASAGNYTVTVSVTDDDLGNGSNSTTHAVIPSATIQVIAASHSVGSGSAPGTVKYPLPLALEVYDKTPAGTGYPSLDPKNFASIYEYEPPSGGTNLATTSPPKAHISGPADITHGGGPAKLYTILVPAGFPNALGTSGAYLVIGKGLVPPANLITVYPGSPTDVLTANTTTQKYLQAGTNGAGKTFPMKTTSVPGSLLLIAEPEYLEFTTDTVLVPIIYESVEGTWDSVVQADPPEGFVASPGALLADVSTGHIDAVQFTVKDVGSDWTFTRIRHQLRHNGRNITVTSQTPMINRQPPRPPRPPQGGGR